MSLPLWGSQVDSGVRSAARLLAVVLGLLGAAALLRPVAAQEATAATLGGGGTIQAIGVEGAQRVEAATIEAYLGLKPGDPFDPVRLDAALKALFATGLFADATLSRQGDVLMVTVVENPLVSLVAFEGNRKLDDDELQAELLLRPRAVYTRAKVQSDVQRLLELYRRRGYFAATVDPKLIELDQNRVNVVFEINEGVVTGISAINFVGNEAFSDSTLRDQISTTESAFWRFLANTDAYDPDRLNFDRELLRRYYLTEGYADFRVDSVVAELTPDRTGFIVTFTVDEGEQYTFGKIDLSTTLKNLDVETLRGELTTIEGDTYNAEEIDNTINLLTDAVGNLGYAFVAVEPRVRRDPDALTIDVTYEIEEGPRVYVERIDIDGNVRTLDKVIRREFRLVEGDAFNSEKIARTRQRIQNLGFFSAVDLTNEPGSSPDKTVVKVKVEEQSTGSFSFGIGYSTDNGPIGTITINERNLLGRGQDLRLNLSIAGRASEVSLSYTDPYFLDRDLSAGFDIFATSNEQDSSDFTQRNFGGTLRTGWSWSEELRQTVAYTLEQQNITNVGEDAPLIIQDDEGKTVTSGVSTNLTYDTRDSRFGPTSGYIASVTNEVTGLGGDTSYYKVISNAAYYIGIVEDVVVKLGASAGAVYGLAYPTRVSNRFFIGGGDLRGFEDGGIGPRDVATGDAIGAKNFYTGTIEMQFPLGLPAEFDIKGRTFIDVGSAWGFDGTQEDPINDSKALRASAGVGLSWNSPFGPLSLDLGYPFLKEDFDETQVFRFDFGTTF